MKESCFWPIVKFVRIRGPSHASRVFGSSTQLALAMRIRHGGRWQTTMISCADSILNCTKGQKANSDKTTLGDLQTDATGNLIRVQVGHSPVAIVFTKSDQIAEGELHMQPGHRHQNHFGQFLCSPLTLLPSLDPPSFTQGLATSVAILVCLLSASPPLPFFVCPWLGVIRRNLVSFCVPPSPSPLS